MDINAKLAELEAMVKNEMKPQKETVKERYGLVLAGGGGKGAYQIGAFRALQERGFIDKICGISGCSVGSLNLTLFAMKDLTSAIDVWSHISKRQFMSIDYELIDFKEGIFSREGLIQIIDDYVNFDDITESIIPLYVNATRFYPDEHKEAVYFKLNDKNKEEIITLLLASSALPIAYENIIYNNMVLKDGGITDNTPIKPLYDEGIRDFIVIDLDENAKEYKLEFIDANFIHIKPSFGIGKLIDGTLDFSISGAKYRMEVGYMDTVRILDKIFEGKYTTTEAFNISSKSDYDNAYFNNFASNSCRSIERNMDKLLEIYNN